MPGRRPVAGTESYCLVMRFTRRRTGILILGLSLVVAACGGGSDDGDPATAGHEPTLTPTRAVERQRWRDLARRRHPRLLPRPTLSARGMTVKGVSRSGEAISLTGTFESGYIDAIQADMVAGLQAAGYKWLTATDAIAGVREERCRPVRVRSRSSSVSSPCQSTSTRGPISSSTSCGPCSSRTRS